MKYETRSVYQVANAIREALQSPDIKPGSYSVKELTKKLVAKKVVKVWELGTRTVQDAVRSTEGWTHNGARARASRYIKPAPLKVVPAYKPAKSEPEESHRGPVAERIARVERMLERLCLSLNIPTE